MCTCNNLELLNTLSNVLFLFPWFFMLPTPQTIFFQPLSALCIFSRLCSASETMFNTSSHRTLSPCCSIAFLPIVAIELTENPSSKCDPLSLPTRVLGVILRKEALNSYWKSPTSFFITVLLNSISEFPDFRAAGL